MTDIEVLLRERLAPIARTELELPPKMESVLPIIQISALPSRVRDDSWNGGPLRDDDAVDIDVFAADLAQCAAVGEQIRESLRSWRHPQVTVIDCPRLTRRPDRNDRIRRRGAVFGFVTS